MADDEAEWSHVALSFPSQMRLEGRGIHVEGRESHFGGAYNPGGFEPESS